MADDAQKIYELLEEHGKYANTCTGIFVLDQGQYFNWQSCSFQCIKTQNHIGWFIQEVIVRKKEQTIARVWRNNGKVL